MNKAHSVSARRLQIAKARDEDFHLSLKNAEKSAIFAV